MSIPTKITPCPIVDTIVEIRFTRKDTPSDAVFGIIYNKIKERFGKYDKLPILDLPLHIRENDNNLKYKPYYRLYDDKFIIQCGADMISIGSKVPYVGWEELSKVVFSTINDVLSTGIIEKIERVGFRYINFFEKRNLDSFNIEIKVNSKDLSNESTAVRTTFTDGDFVQNLQITNNIEINKKQNLGTIVDIDVYKQFNLDNFSTEHTQIINKCHKSEKNLFFNLLKQDLLNSFKIEY